MKSAAQIGDFLTEPFVNVSPDAMWKIQKLLSDSSMRYPVILLCLALASREVHARQQDGSEICGCEGPCEVDAALLLQNQANTALSTIQLRNITKDEIAVQASELVETEKNVSEKVADQMAKQMSWEFNCSGGKLLKLSGTRAMARITQDSRLLSGEEQSLFVRAVYRAVPPHSLGETEAKIHVKLDIAAPGQVLWVYLLLWMPLAVAWLWSGFLTFQNISPSQSLDVRQLIQLTVGALTISTVITNQSLCIVTRAPMALTMFQSAIAICIGATLWTFQAFCRPQQHLTAAQIGLGKTSAQKTIVRKLPELFLHFLFGLYINSNLCS